MKKIVFLMVLALAACGEKSTSLPNPLSAPSVRELLRDDARLDEVFAACKKNGEYRKAERSETCDNALHAQDIRQTHHQFSRCGLRKYSPAELDACYQAEYDKDHI